MARIHLTTFMAAPVERVFDLSRHLVIYKSLFQGRKEQLTSVAASGLMNKDETISVMGKLAGKTRLIMLKMAAINKPESFIEEQVRGDMMSFRHEHHFKRVDNGTIVIDIVDYEQPKDFLGKIIGHFYLKGYLENLINRRNEFIRGYAESEKWRVILT